MPFMHREPLLVGASGSPAILTTTPFSTYTLQGHAWMQPWQTLL